MRISQHIVFFLFFLKISTSLSAGDEAAKQTVKDIGLAEAKTMVEEWASKSGTEKETFVILDVRTAEEFADGHIQGAVLLDFLEKSFQTQLEKLDRKKVYLVHCQAGGRSNEAKNLMKKLGFSSVYHLKDGFGAWEDAGHPIAVEMGEEKADTKD